MDGRTRSRRGGVAQDILSGAFTDENVVVFVERLLDLPAGVR